MRSLRRNVGELAPVEAGGIDCVVHFSGFRFALLMFTTIALLHPAWATTAGVPVVPTWIKNDLEKKRTTIIIAADWNTNNEWANLNGYYRGNATIFVPVDWTVTIQFTNNSDHYPHGLILTKQFTEGSLPIKLTAADVVDGVMTRDAF